MTGAETSWAAEREARLARPIAAAAARAELLNRLSKPAEYTKCLDAPLQKFAGSRAIGRLTASHPDQQASSSKGHRCQGTGLGNRQHQGSGERQRAIECGV